MGAVFVRYFEKPILKFNLRRSFHILIIYNKYTIRKNHYLSVGLLQTTSLRFSPTSLWLSSSAGGGGKGNSSHGLLTLGIWPPDFKCVSGDVTILLVPAIFGFLFGEPGGDGNFGRLRIEEELDDERSNGGPWLDTGVVPLEDCSDWGLGVAILPFDIFTGGELRDGGLEGGIEGVCPLGGVSGGGVLSLDACRRWGFFGGLSGGFSCPSLVPFCCVVLLLKIMLDGLLLLLEFLLDHERSCCWEAFVEDDLRSRLSVRTIGWLYFLRWLCLLSCCWMLPP